MNETTEKMVQNSFNIKGLTKNLFEASRKIVKTNMVNNIKKEKVWVWRRIERMRKH